MGAPLNRLIQRTPSLFTSGDVLGSIDDYLRKGITSVISVVPVEQRTVEFARIKGIEVIHIVPDLANDRIIFDKIDQLTSSGKKVAVACFHGKGLSRDIVTKYIETRLRKTKKPLLRVKRRRRPR